MRFSSNRGKAVLVAEEMDLVVFVARYFSFSFLQRIS